jgi:hypothetical protein
MIQRLDGIHRVKLCAMNRNVVGFNCELPDWIVADSNIHMCYADVMDVGLVMQIDVHNKRRLRVFAFRGTSSSYPTTLGKSLTVDLYELIERVYIKYARYNGFFIELILPEAKRTFYEVEYGKTDRAGEGRQPDVEVTVRKLAFGGVSTIGATQLQPCCEFCGDRTAYMMMSKWTIRPMCLSDRHCSNASSIHDAWRDFVSEQSIVFE